jgi:hypothetical protein
MFSSSKALSTGLRVADDEERRPERSLLKISNIDVEYDCRADFKFKNTQAQRKRLSEGEVWSLGFGRKPQCWLTDAFPADFGYPSATSKQ